MIFGVLGAMLLCAGLFLGWKQNQIVAVWPKVEATVTQSRVVMKSPTTFGAEITISYPVGGKERTNTITPGYETASREAMETKLKDFAPGSQHPIRYNPASPDTLIFNAGYTSDFFTLPLVLSLTGLILIGIGAAPVMLGRVRQPAKADENAADDTDGVVKMVGGTFAAIGALILAVALAMNLNLMSRQTWPKTEATVARSEIVSYQTGGTNGNPTSTYFVAKIEFRYRVNEREYTAPITAGNGAKSRERHAPILKTFAPGTRHPIHYNPDNFNAITFAGEGRLWVWIIGAMGGGFLGIGLLCLVVFRARPAKH